jgi:competence protein ComGC
MELSGNLKKFPLPKVLQFLNMDQASGVLRLNKGKRQITLLLEEGNILDVKDSERPIAARMGEVLLRSGKVTEQEWNVLSEEQKARLEPMSKVLTDANFLSHEEQQRLVKLVYFETLIEALQLTEGQYEFEHKEGLMPSELPDPISVNSLMLNLARQEDEWGELRKIVPSRDAVFGRSPDIQDEAWDKAMSSLSREEQRVAKSLDGFSTVGMVGDITFSNDFDVANIIAELARRGLVVRVFEQEAAYAQSRPKTFFSINIGPTALKILYATAALLLLLMVWSKALLPMIANWQESRVVIETAGLNMETANDMRIMRLQNAFYTFLKEKGEPPTSLQALMREGYISEKDLQVVGGGRFVLKVIGLQEESAFIQAVDENGSNIKGLSTELFVR